MRWIALIMAVSFCGCIPSHPDIAVRVVHNGSELHVAMRPVSPGGETQVADRRAP